MKHSPFVASPLLTEDDLLQMLRAAHDGRRGEQGRAAADLGISQGQLSNILRGGRAITAPVAEALGYRRVIRFEPIE